MHAVPAKVEQMMQMSLNSEKSSKSSTFPPGCLSTMGEKGTICNNNNVTRRYHFGIES